MFLQLYICLLFIETALSVYLIYLNIRYMRKQVSHNKGIAHTYLTEQEIQDSVAYNIVRMKFGAVSVCINLSLILTALVFNLPGFFEILIRNYTANTIIIGVTTVILSSALFFIPNIFLSYYSQFVIEEQFGFNTMTRRLFVQDTVKSTILGMLIGAPVLAVLIVTVNLTGSLWWILGAVFITAVQVFLLFIFPVVLAPIFYTFTPLKEGELKDRIEKLASNCGFTMGSIQVMDGSRRSRHGNAFFTGFGSTRKIALFDTLIESLDTDELEAVVAHELGHAKLGHIKKQLATSIVLLFALFYLLSLLLDFSPLYDLFGLSGGTIYGLLTFALYFSSPFTFLFGPVSAIFSRKREFEADRYAFNRASNRSALSSGLVKLHKDNKSNPFPHPAYSFFNYSHPPVWERLKALKGAGEDSTT